jgi:hypothetical protein
MRTLKELGALVASEASKRYFAKRANIINPMAFGMGLQLPHIAEDVKKRYLDTQRQLALAATTQLGERVASAKEAGFGDRVMSGIKSIDTGKVVTDIATKTLGSLASDAIKGTINGVWGSFAHRNDDKARDAILADLKKNDSIIKQAPAGEISQAYSSMVRFAPTLSTDINAVRSYLRESVMSGAGPNYATIKALADAENTVTGKGKKD